MSRWIGLTQAAGLSASQPAAVADLAVRQLELAAAVAAVRQLLQISHLHREEQRSFPSAELLLLEQMAQIRGSTALRWALPVLERKAEAVRLRLLARPEGLPREAAARSKSEAMAVLATPRY